MRPSQLDYAKLALFHWAASRHEAPEAQVALAHFAKNLFSFARLTSTECGMHLLALARSTADFSDALGLGLCHMDTKPSLELLRAFFFSTGLDPTGGALRAHLHTENPAWADRSRPTSLIGPWIFYRLR